MDIDRERLQDDYGVPEASSMIRAAERVYGEEWVDSVRETLDEEYLEGWESDLPDDL